MADELLPASPPLSPEVLVASDRILAELVAAQRDRVRRRRSRKALGSAFVLALAAVGSLWLLPARQHASGVSRGPTPSPSSSPSIEIVQSAPRPITVEYLTDDDLIAELRAAGINAGLARTSDRVMIVGR